jgi:DUF4097 and DUF4098 domain-containing protein YvlB
MTEFHTPQPIRLRVNLPAGLVDVTAAQTDTTTVELAAQDESDKTARQLAEDTTVELRGDELVIAVPRGYRLRKTPGLDVRVTLPTDSAVRGSMASADFHARGRLGQLHLDSASGDIEVEESGGDVEVRTASGDTSVGRGEGRIQVSTASGEVRIGVAAAGFDVKSASGDVTVGEVSGSSAARSASGDVTVRTARSGEIEANTASGDVRVGVAPGTGVYLDLSTLSGDTTSHLQPETEPANGPDLQLRLRTLSGDIDVVRSS